MSEKENKNSAHYEVPKPKCGIVMPISPIDGCSAEHWAEVLTILKDIITSIDFDSNLVSDADEIGIIQKRIIQNLYNNEIVICDVSAKNPNVMFELGMRLAFDKPTIIIKDDKTDYTFDTSVIEHLSYPRDLRFTRILEFKDNLAKKIRNTYQKAKSDPQYSTFLKNFGQYKIAHLQETEISSNDFILTTLTDIKNEISRFKSLQSDDRVINSIARKEINRNSYSTSIKEYIEASMRNFQHKKKIQSFADLEKHVDEVVEYLKANPDIKSIFPNEKLLKEMVVELIPPF